MRNIKAIVFDLGNVLIYFDWNLAIKNLEKIQAGLGKKTTQFLKSNQSLIHALECGHISQDDFLNEIKRNLDSSLSKEELAKIYSNIFWENLELTSILPLLRKSYKLYLLSNTNLIHRKYGWEQFHFLKYFDKLFLSYEIGHVKPEIEIYEYVINSIDYLPSEILYIDDIEEYVKRAESLGWHTIRYVNNEQLFLALLDYGIKINRGQDG